MDLVKGGILCGAGYCLKVFQFLLLCNLGVKRFAYCESVAARDLVTGFAILLLKS